MTRKELRKQTADNIRQVADFGDNGAIQAAVELIRDAIKEGDMDEVEKWLKHIEECCVSANSTNTRNYHAMEMMYHFALAIGEKYDPMY